MRHTNDLLPREPPFPNWYWRFLFILAFLGATVYITFGSEWKEFSTTPILTPMINTCIGLDIQNWATFEIMITHPPYHSGCSTFIGIRINNQPVKRAEFTMHDGTKYYYEEMDK